MQNNLDYLYTQLNELNSKIGSTYSYIDNNNLSESKINQLNLKCDYMIARANKIEQKIKLLENDSQKPDKDDSNIIFIFTSIIFSIIILIYAITTIL